MMKKFLSVLLSVATFLGMTAVYVSADVKPWTITVYGTGENRYVEQTDVKKYDGDFSLSVQYSGTRKNAANYIEVKMMLTEELLPGNYTFSLYNSGRASAHTEISVGEGITFGFGDMEQVEENEWIKYTKTVSYEGDGEDFVAVRFYGGTSQAYLDNISLIAEDSGENLVKDGGFEFYEEPEPETEEPWDTTDYRPLNFMAIPFKGSVALSWKNPASATLDDIVVYDITDGKEELVTDEIATTAKKLINYEITNLEDRIYQYKVIFSYRDKGDFTYFLSSGTSEADPLKGSAVWGEWTYSRAGHGKAGYTPAAMMLDYDIKRGEEGSALKVVSNIDRSRGEFHGNTFVRLTQNLPLETGKKYSVSYWTKAQNVSDGFQVNFNGAAFDGMGLVLPYSGTHDWTFREYTYTYSAESQLRFLDEYACESIWFDDVEVYLLDENGEKKGKNLVKGGDFNGIANETVGEISDVWAESQKESIILNWTVPSKNCMEIRLYEKKFDNYEFRGTLTASAGSVEISNLDIEKEYTYKLCPVNDYGIEGEGVEVTAKTVIPDYEIFESSLTQNGYEVTELSGAGSYTAVVPVKNSGITEGVNVEIFAAVYKDNALEELYSTSALVEKTSKSRPPKEIKATFELPDGEGYHVEIFVVDSRNSLDILQPCKTYN